MTKTPSAPRGRPPFDARSATPANEGARRLLLCIAHHGGLTATAQQYGIAVSSVHLYVQVGKLPSLENAIRLQRESGGVIGVTTWLDEPGPWPPKNIEKAYATLLARARKETKR